MVSTNIQRIINPVLIALALLLGVVVFASPVAAQNPERDICEDIQNGTYTPDDPNTPANEEKCVTGQDTLIEGEDSVFRRITNTLIFLVGAIAVIMLIIGGIRYTVSGGDQNAVAGAKNTILYAIVGIIVSFLAFAIVNFILNSI